MHCTDVPTFTVELLQITVCRFCANRYLKRDNRRQMKCKQNAKGNFKVKDVHVLLVDSESRLGLVSLQKSRRLD